MHGIMKLQKDIGDFYLFLSLQEERIELVKKFRISVFEVFIHFRRT